jgi:hypothetical protein
MKAKLYKVLDQYHLYDGDKAIATTIVGNPMLLPNLSKQNCDEIFGIIDVELMADFYGASVKGSLDFKFGANKGFEDGFNKAMELNKDKVFTLEDIRKTYYVGYEDGKSGATFFQQLIQSLQQPTEIEVEIVMKNSRTGKIIKSESDLEWDEDGLCDRAVPKLNSEGCLILKKI